MSRPVSLLVWRDAKSDPPTGDMERYVLFVDYEQFVEMVTAREVVGACDLDARWAELPVLSDLTDDDVRQIDIILHALDAQAVYLGDPATRQPDLSEKFHAAAYGTQEDT